VNGGACSFLIYACALLGFFFKPRTALLGLAGIIGGVALQGWLLHLLPWLWVFTIIFGAFIGGLNIHAAEEKRGNAKLRLAQDEVERLAKVAERERIARDLHDVLGHTLSVIILKSELAGRLFERDQQRAYKEITEVESIARGALSEVRQAIGGYRASSLAEELALARSLLQTADIEVDAEAEDVGRLPPAQETVLALALREAVTNVVRHSGARFCKLRLSRDSKWVRLTVEDNGRGGSASEGNGLQGMRERIEALDGTLVRRSERGTSLSIEVPIRSKREATA
jgi:two-component system sensor histidine kinase DesK